jgi:hypothetical protein
MLNAARRFPALSCSQPILLRRSTATGFHGRLLRLINTSMIQLKLMYSNSLYDMPKK